MSGLVQRRYGGPDALEVRSDLPVPNVGPEDVLVRVHAAGVDAGTLILMRGKPTIVRPFVGVRRPRQPVPGRGLAGTVTAVGEAVTRLRPGDEVYGESTGAAFAELAAVPEKRLAVKPSALTFAQAATVPVSGTTAWQAVRRGAVEAGKRVAVTGASGGVGTFAVQIAKARGAHVTGIASGPKLDLVRSLGADEVIDHTREDFAQANAAYDVILDVAGRHSLRDYRRALRPGGTLVLVGGPPERFLRRMLAVLAQKPVVSERLLLLTARSSREDLEALGELLADGRVTPAVDSAHPLADARTALERLDRGQVRGKVVITFAAAGR
jgi:NADPH:quinone reductase-like Zn-dependent oxidoreductase